MTLDTTNVFLTRNAVFSNGISANGKAWSRAWFGIAINSGKDAAGRSHTTFANVIWWNPPKGVQDKLVVGAHVVHLSFSLENSTEKLDNGKTRTHLELRVITCTVNAPRPKVEQQQELPIETTAEVIDTGMPD